MNTQTIDPPHAPRADSLLELAEVADGIVDFGTTVCLIGAERMAGCGEFIVRRESELRAALRSACCELHDLPNNGPLRTPEVVRTLAGGTERFLRGFVALERHRELPVSELHAATYSIRLGWEEMRRSIREVVGAFGLSADLRYSAAVDREPTVRERLGHLDEWFSRAAVESADLDQPASA